MESTTHVHWLGAGLLLGRGAGPGRRPPAALSRTVLSTKYLVDSALFREAAGGLRIRPPYRYVPEDPSQDPAYDFNACGYVEPAQECP